MKYRIVSYLRIDPDPEDEELYNTFAEAHAEKKHIEGMHGDDVRVVIETVPEPEDVVLRFGPVQLGLVRRALEIFVHDWEKDHVEAKSKEEQRFRVADNLLADLQRIANERGI